MASTIMDPTGRTSGDAEAGLELARRSGDLRGATVGLLENGKQNARLFLEEVGSVLEERYGISAVTMRRKEVFTAPVPAETVEEMKAECDVVVTGIGDCGSCSASAVADGVLFERHGVPAAVICSEAFRTTADAMAEIQGAPGYRYLTTAHPVAGLTPEQVRERAELVADQVAEMLAAERSHQAA
ncbi:MAG TPA: UGSC family (seleno)protein [Thermoleophilaceae bacterium]|jgi:hypothetical protein